MATSGCVLLFCWKSISASGAVLQASLQLPEVIHGLLRLRFDCCWNTTKVDSIFFVGLEFSLAFVILGDVPDCFPEMALSHRHTHSRGTSGALGDGGGGRFFPENLQFRDLELRNIRDESRRTNIEIFFPLSRSRVGFFFSWTLGTRTHRNDNTARGLFLVSRYTRTQGERTHPLPEEPFYQHSLTQGRSFSYVIVVDTLA